MKTVVFLAALVALAVAGTVPSTYHVDTKTVDDDYVHRQTLVFKLVESIGQYRKDADYWKIGYEYDVEANINNYTNKEAIEEFLLYYKSGFMPKYKTFSVFYHQMREEAIALFKLFFYAKDFETFYKTAAFARVHLNDGLFLSAFFTAIYQRPDTHQLVLPAPYEMFPQYFVNTKTFLKAYRMKMQNGDIDPAYGSEHGIFFEKDSYVLYSNYTSPWLTGKEEAKLSYFTEDIGMNEFYYFHKMIFPFWWKESSFKHSECETFRPPTIYYYYQQLIALYYNNRLSNGLGEIPKFSWYKPIKTGYYCELSTYYPFFQRNEWYQINKPENAEDIQFLDHYEQTFLYYLEQGHFKAYNQEIDLRNSKAIDFVSKYWFADVDLYEKAPRNYERLYELTGLHLLAGTPEPADKYTIVPSALEIYQTSLRDPVFYQFYAHILNYGLQWQEYLEPYSYKQLHFEGVKINDVKVDKLVTFFESYDFHITNDIFHSVEEFKAGEQTFKVRQPRLNHKPFNVTVDVKSDVATDAVVKFFFGPKYDSKGYPLNIEDNWMNFYGLDWFVHKLTPGQNKIERKSDDFVYFKQDSVPVNDIIKMLYNHKKVPLDMSENFFYKPNRMMLPKGVKGGFPFQIYVVVYPHTPLPEQYESVKMVFPDMKPPTYPFDRPVYETYFKQPNIYHEDVFVYHEGEEYTNTYNVHEYYKNTKHTEMKI